MSMPDHNSTAATDFSRADAERLVRIETTLLSAADRDTDLAKRDDDHEHRIRRLERFAYLGIGLGAAVGSSLGSWLGQALPPV